MKFLVAYAIPNLNRNVPENAFIVSPGNFCQFESKLSFFFSFEDRTLKSRV